jgi:hypothetical protein
MPGFPRCERERAAPALSGFAPSSLAKSRRRAGRARGRRRAAVRADRLFHGIVASAGDPRVRVAKRGARAARVRVARQRTERDAAGGAHHAERLRFRTWDARGGVASVTRHDRIPVAVATGAAAQRILRRAERAEWTPPGHDAIALDTRQLIARAVDVAAADDPHVALAASRALVGPAAEKTCVERAANETDRKQPQDPTYPDKHARSVAA